MPDAAEIGAVILAFDDFGDLRKSLDAFQQRIVDRIAESLGESEELGRREFLIAKEDHQMIEQGLADGCDRCRADASGQVHPANFGTERSGDRGDSQGGRIGHGRS